MQFFQAIVLSAAMELGVLNGAVYNYDKPVRALSSLEYPLYVSLEAQARSGIFFAGGSIESLVWMDKPLSSYIPFQINFTTSVGMRFDNVVLGFDHICFHPIKPYSPLLNDGIMPKYEGSYEKFYLRVETK